jgi:hypothetical protein
MSPLDSKNHGITRRLDRVIRRQRIRTFLMVVGFGLVILGIWIAIAPFGAPVSNSVVIPKADPHAGIALIQALPSEFMRPIALAIALLGVAALSLSVFLNSTESRNDANRKG